MMRRVMGLLGITALTFVLAVRADQPAAKTGGKPDAKSDSPDKKAPEIKDKTSLQQRIILQRFAEFKAVVLRVKQRLEKGSPEDREKAKALQNALDEIDRKHLDTEFSRMVKLLNDKNLGNVGDVQEAVDQSKKLAAEMQVLINILKEDSRAARLREERQRLQELIAELKGVIKDQEMQRAKTAMERMAKEDLVKGQKRVSDRTADLYKKMGGKEGNGQGKKDDHRGESKARGKGGDKAGESKNKGDSEGKNKEAGQKGKNGSKEGANKAGNSKGQGKEGSKNGGKEGSKAGSKSGGKQGGKEGSKAGSSKDGGKQGGKEGSKEGSKNGSKEGSKEGSKQGSKPGENKKQGSQGESKGKGQGKGGESSKGKGQQGASKSGGQSGSKGKSGGQQGGQQGNQGNQGNQGDQNNKNQDDQSQDTAEARQKVKEGRQYQKDAEKQLEKDDKKKAGTAEDKAIEELKKAQKRLEELLKQTREEELERLLNALENRCRQLLEMQRAVKTATVELDKLVQANPDKKPTRSNQQDSGRLGDKEKEIIIEASKAIDMIEQEGSAVAFAEVFKQVRSDMEEVQKLLNLAKTGNLTQAIEQDIIDSLEDMIKALQKAKQDLNQQKNNPSQSPPPNQQDQKLLDQIAELKMIRAMQVKINKRTKLYASEYVAKEGEQTTDPAIKQKLGDLSERQEKLFDVTMKIVKGENK